jgi:hypothetical protein
VGSDIPEAVGVVGVAVWMAVVEGEAMAGRCRKAAGMQQDAAGRL